MTEPAGALSANQIAVQVLDEWGRPVSRVTVSFRLPEAGPGGAFLNGLSTEVVLTDREGKAAVQGFDWRAEAGSTFMHVIAAYGEVRAGAMVEIQLARKATREVPPAVLSAPSNPAHPTEPRPSGRGHASPSAGDEAAKISITEANPAEPRSLGRRPGSPLGNNEIEGNPSTATNQSRLGRVAPVPTAESQRAAILGPTQPAPRDAVPEAPDPNLAAAEATSFVTVKKNSSGGGSKALLILLIAGAAAGGALAAGMAGGGGSSSGNNPVTPSTPSITIGNPTIIVTGGN